MRRAAARKRTSVPASAGRRVAYFDCATGAAGDMILGALVDAGAPLLMLEDALGGLEVGGFVLRIRPVKKHGVRATKADVCMAGIGGRGAATRRRARAAAPIHGHVGLAEIRRILGRSRLPEAVRADSLRIFARLAEVEAGIHGTSVERVHFHEVGAVDSIVDIVGSVAALDLLGIDEVFCSPFPVSHGTVACEHGRLPVPAPAALALMKGTPLVPSDLSGELVTPTAAAILTTLCARPGAFPAMNLEAVGYGAGARELPDRPNVLRVLVGHQADGPDPTMPPRERVWVVEASLDDATGEAVGYAFDRLFSAGALDVHAAPVQMKKNRPGVVLSAIVPEPALASVEEVFLRETTTLGVRRHPVERSVLPREQVEVKTRYGKVRVKVAYLRGEPVTASPEFDDCRRLAAENGVPLREIMAEAARAWAGMNTRKRRRSRATARQ